MARSARKLKRVPKPQGLAEKGQPFVHDGTGRGIPAKRVQQLIDKGVLSQKAVFRAIPERTFKRRLAKRDVLKTPEADAIARLLRVTEAARRAFGEEDFARRWLNLPVPSLNDAIPIELAETDA